MRSCSLQLFSSMLRRLSSQFRGLTVIRLDKLDIKSKPRLLATSIVMSSKKQKFYGVFGNEGPKVYYEVRKKDLDGGGQETNSQPHQ